MLCFTCAVLYVSKTKPCFNIYSYPSQTHSTKERQKMIVSVNSMNSRKMGYLLWVRQENCCALYVEKVFHIIEDMILADTVKHSIRLKLKEN